MDPQVRSLLEDLLVDGELQRTFPEVHAMVGFGGGEQGHKDLWGHTKQVVFQCPYDLILRWAALFHDVGKIRCFARHNDEVSFHGHEVAGARLFRQAAARTQLFNARETGDIFLLIGNLGYVEAYDSGWTDNAVRRLRNAVVDHFDNLISLSRADITTRHDHKRVAHHTRIQELKNRADAILKADSATPMLPRDLGIALQNSLGITPSPLLGKVIAAIKAAVAAGDLPWPPTIDQAVEHAKTVCISQISAPLTTPEILLSTEDLTTR
jgi:poly(A) polymerase